MDKRKNVSTYDSIAYEYDKLFSAPSCHIKDLLRYVEKESAILDLGCGSGNNAVYLSNLGYNVTGIDASDNMLTIAKNKKSHAKFIQGDVSQLNFNNNSFNCIILSYILCHLTNNRVSNCLAQLNHILQDKGILFIELFTGELGEITITEPLNTTLTTDFNIIRIEDMETMLGANNFEIIKKYSKPETEFGWPGVQDTCIIAHKI